MSVLYTTMLIACSLMIFQCDPDTALSTLGACVVNSQTKAADEIKAELSEECQKIYNDAVTTGLAPIQAYYANLDQFDKDLRNIVSLNVGTKPCSTPTP